MAGFCVAGPIAPPGQEECREATGWLINRTEQPPRLRGFWSLAHLLLDRAATPPVQEGWLRDTKPALS
jgi:hypothetical protein